MDFQASKPPVFQLDMESGIVMWHSPGSDPTPTQYFCRIDDLRSALAVPVLQVGLANVQSYQTLRDQQDQRKATPPAPMGEIFTGKVEIVETSTGKLSGKLKARHKDNTRNSIFKKKRKR